MEIEPDWGPANAELARFARAAGTHLAHHARRGGRHHAVAARQLSFRRAVRRLGAYMSGHARPVREGDTNGRRAAASPNTPPKWIGTPPRESWPTPPRARTTAKSSSRTAAPRASYWDDGRLKSATFDATQGFGLRVVAGERAGYGHASVLETDAVSRAAEAAAAVKLGHDGPLDVSPAKVNRQLYADFDPIESPLFTDKTGLLAEIDAYCRAKDPRVVQVAATLAGARRGLTILRPDGAKLTDHRPLVRINVSVTVERDGRRESRLGGRGRARAV